MKYSFITPLSVLLLKDLNRPILHMFSDQKRIIQDYQNSEH